MGEGLPSIPGQGIFWPGGGTHFCRQFPFLSQGVLGLEPISATRVAVFLGWKDMRLHGALVGSGLAEDPTYPPHLPLNQKCSLRHLPCARPWGQL